ncbi:hypothetical protein BDN70DRAFT_938350 [Pholiota conissans]|uniref:Uncharacterized protein n=1 Tax=Pholiota conissans TaxID=109636 RepID=A0A9P5YR84_9AGAR|nr:hypothetical protein BDN70DRAFT_938350 [Pholiota conissans]
MNTFLPNPPTLPYDIQLEVIKIALNRLKDPDDLAHALISFSLISQPLRIFCQKQIFRRFVTGKETCYLRKRILANSPHLIPYVKELCFRYEEDPIPGPDRHISTMEMEVIQTLTSLERISAMVKRNRCSWCDFPQCVRHLIIDFTIRRRITSLYFEGLANFPPPFVAYWKFLDSVDVREGAWYPHYTSMELSPNSEEAFEQARDEDSFEDVNSLLLFEKAPKKSTLAGSATTLTSLCLLDCDDILFWMLANDDDVLDVPYVTRPGDSFKPDTWQSQNALAANGSGEDDNHNQGRHNRAVCDHYTPVFSSDTTGKSAIFDFDFSRLRTLTVDITPGNLRPLWHIIHEASGSIVSLDIRERLRFWSTNDPFGFPATSQDLSRNLPRYVSLASLSHLRVLTLEMFLRCIGAETTMPYTLASWSALLRTAPYEIRVLDLRISLYEGSRWYMDPYEIFISPPDDEENDNDSEDEGSFPNAFDTLDDVISSTFYFPSLEFVRLHLYIPEPDPEDSEAGMDVDVVDEEDVEVMQAWATNANAHGYLGENDKTDRYTKLTWLNDATFVCESGGVGGTTTNYNASPSSSSISGADCDLPSFSDDESGRASERSILREDILTSVDYMFGRTRRRFASTKSFVVTADIAPNFTR